MQFADYEGVNDGEFYVVAKNVVILKSFKNCRVYEIKIYYLIHFNVV